jgi:NADH-quinone oxidoreductase subunit J
MSLSFMILASLALITAILTVTLRRLFYATLALAAFLLSIAGLYLTLFSEFLAVIQVLVYVGAVVVLILFLLMITGYREEEIPLKEIPKKNWLKFIIFVNVLAFSLILIILFYKELTPSEIYKPPEVSNYHLANLLLKKWLAPFELISIVLLVALVGSVGLLKKR